MVKLLARTPAQGHLPRVVGACSLIEQIPEAMVLLAPSAGQGRQVSETLKKRYGIGFPGANRSLTRRGVRITWFGPGQAMFQGPRPEPISGAAQSDQSDGWAVMRLSGAGAEAVLARLVSVDLRVTMFKRGHTARTQLFHMPLSVTRVGLQEFQLMVFRSMTLTAIEELTRAMGSVDALSQSGPG